MEYWEFLIQREGDRGWRPIRTGHLQLTEGKYRLVANSNLFDTQIQTRLTHQTPGSIPRRRSQSCDRTTNSSGLLLIIPFTHLHAGIWQFVCSGTTTAQKTWHQILKLRVLPRTPTHPPTFTNPLQLETLANEAVELQQIARQFSHVDRGADIDPPIEPIVPIEIGKQENWADELDRLLARLERDSVEVHRHQPAVNDPLLGTIQINQIDEPPLQLIGLNRSTFSGLIPGNRLTINGSCNLQLLNVNLVQTVKIEKLSICLRHPQTSEIITSIEQPLPPNLDTFTFSGQLELPTEPKISLLLGEVNLYDKHHIQLASSGFTLTLNLNPLHESELSLLQLFDLGTDTPASMAQINQELQVDTVTIGQHNSNSRPPESPTPSKMPFNPARSPSVPLADRQGSFTHPDIVPILVPRRGYANESSSTKYTPNPEVVGKTATTHSHQIPNTDTTDNLDLDFAQSAVCGGASAIEHRHYDTLTHQNLEIVIDD